MIKSKINIILSQKGRVGKTTIATNIIPKLLDAELEKIHIFEIYSNDTFNITNSKMHFHRIKSQNELDNVCIDILYEYIMNEENLSYILDYGDDKIDNFLKSLEHITFKIDKFYIPIVEDFEVINSLEPLINTIKKYYQDSKIYLILNKVNNTNDDEIKKQFKFLYHDEFSIQKAKETLKKIDEILVVPNLNNISNIKNIYNFTIRDLEEILKQTQINMILKKTQALKF